MDIPSQALWWKISVPTEKSDAAFRCSLKAPIHVHLWLDELIKPYRKQVACDIMFLRTTWNDWSLTTYHLLGVMRVLVILKVLNRQLLHFLVTIWCLNRFCLFAAIPCFDFFLSKMSYPATDVENIELDVSFVNTVKYKLHPLLFLYV